MHNIIHGEKQDSIPGKWRGHNEVLRRLRWRPEDQPNDYRRRVHSIHSSRSDREPAGLVEENLFITPKCKSDHRESQGRCSSRKEKSGAKMNFTRVGCMSV